MHIIIIRVDEKGWALRKKGTKQKLFLVFRPKKGTKKRLMNFGFA